MIPSMKSWNQTFTSVVEVRVLAEKLLGTFLFQKYPEVIQSKGTLFIEEKEFIALYDAIKGDYSTHPKFELDSVCHFSEYIKDMEYYIGLVEVIIDNICENDYACSQVFNKINGWIKMPTPTDKNFYSEEDIFGKDDDNHNPVGKVDLDKQRNFD